jgi:hypothetical protein
MPGFLSSILPSSAGSLQSPSIANNLSSGNLANVTGNYSPVTYTELRALPDPVGHWMWVADIKCPVVKFDRGLIQDITVPFMGFSAETRFRGGFLYNFPKFSSVGSLSLTFQETVDYRISTSITRWVNSICDEDGNYALPKDYMGNITTTAFDTSGIPAIQFQMLYVWPERPGDINFQSSSGLLTINCSFAISRVQLTYVAQNVLDSSPIANLINPYSGLQNLNPSIVAGAFTGVARAQLGSIL